MRSKRSARGRLLTLALLAIPLAALVLLGASFARTMDHTAERLAGSNSVKLQQPVVQVSGGGEVCQETVVPRDSASVLLFVAPTGPTGPPIALTITDGTRTVASGHIAGGWLGGVAKIPIPRVRTTVPAAQLCARNEGREPLAFSGLPSDLVTVKVDGKAVHAALTIQFFRPGTSSWWSLLPTIAHRAGVLKGSLAGAWAFWLAAALVAACGLLSLALVIRSGRA